MDPVTVGYLILALVQVTNNAYNLVNSIKYSAPKVDQIYYRLLAEKETTEAWANQMRIANGMDLQTSIPPDKLEEVSKLLNKLVEYVKKAEQKYAKVELKPADQKNTMTNLRARALFVLSGYDDLKDLVEVIASMNKALITIAPPLPPYSRHMHSEGSTRTQVQQFISDEGEAYSSGPETGQPSSALASMDGTTAIETNFSRTQVEQPLRKGTNMSTRSVYDLDHLPSLKSIYELCFNALDMMAHRRMHPLLQRASGRLKLWGTGIFEPPLPLDTVLTVRKKDSNTVRKAYLKAMAYILVLQERDLGRLKDSVKDQTEDEHRRLAIMQAEISSMLGTDELVESSLTSWANSLQRQKDIVAVLQQHPTTKPDDLRNIETILDFQSISRTIETMFDLLPAIRSERRTYWLLREAEQAAKDADTQSLNASLQANSTIEDDMHKIEDFIKKRDAKATRQGRQVRLYEPVFRKEKDRLENLRHAKDKQFKITSKTTDNSIVQEKKDQLAKILSTFAREIDSADGKDAANQKLVSSGKKPVDVYQSSDMKGPVSDSRVLDDENLTALIDSLKGLSL